MKLHHTLAEALPTETGVVAQLVAPERDDALTEVAYDLAYISASWLDKRVLYVDGTDMRDGRPRLSPQERFNVGQLRSRRIWSVRSPAWSVWNCIK